MVAVNLTTKEEIPLKNVWIEDSDGSFWTASPEQINTTIFSMGSRSFQYPGDGNTLTIYELIVNEGWGIKHYILWNPGK